MTVRLTGTPASTPKPADIQSLPRVNRLNAGSIAIRTRHSRNIDEALTLTSGPSFATDPHSAVHSSLLTIHNSAMWAITPDPCDEKLIRSRPAATPCSKAAGRWVLAATILASSMAFIDSTVVNVALAALQTDLNATAVDVQWVIEAYALLLSAFLLIGGSLGDVYGRRRVFLIGVVLFTIASAACGVSISIKQLIVARAFQGLGAAFLIPGSLAIISSSFDDRERGRAIGTWSAFSAITSAIGPVFGGWLIEHLSWRAVFFINVPVALVVIAVALFHIRENVSTEKARVDWLGALLAVLGLGALVYGLLEYSRENFASTAVVVNLVAAAALLVMFVIVESKASNPMLPLALFRSKMFTGANLLTFLVYGALGGTLLFLPLNLIQVQHYSPTAAGAALLPFILIISLLSRWSGGLLTKYGARLPLIVGPLVAALGFALFAAAGLNANYWTTFFPAAAVLGLGMAITVAPLTTAVMSAIDQKHAGTASGVNNAVARTAGLIAIAVLGIVMFAVFSRSVDQLLGEAKLPQSVVEAVKSQRTRLAAIELPKNHDPAIREVVRRVVDESFVAGFRTVMTIGSILAAAGALTAIVLIDDR